MDGAAAGGSALGGKVAEWTLDAKIAAAAPSGVVARRRFGDEEEEEGSEVGVGAVGAEVNVEGIDGASVEVAFNFLVLLRVRSLGAGEEEDSVGWGGGASIWTSSSSALAVVEVDGPLFECFVDRKDLRGLASSFCLPLPLPKSTADSSANRKVTATSPAPSASASRLFLAFFLAGPFFGAELSCSCSDGSSTS